MEYHLFQYIPTSNIRIVYNSVEKIVKKWKKVESYSYFCGIGDFYPKT